MFKRILFPTDGSDITAKALITAVDLARTQGAEIHTLAVKEPFPYSAITEMQPMPPQEFYDAQERFATQHLQQVEQACQAAKVACTMVKVESLHPWEAILEYTRGHDCDLIVMASHGRRGLAGLLLGSETQKVLTHSTTPVLVVR
ncbi:universal stress protein UspA-like protein [Leptothrix ochracea L12]|uniref:Universal stress protein UspA-like protein n=1 Tax=Leptothrix ochracea L12 TaxID=735332 RepID=I4Z5A4_9BURK|nr:universal stress protein [Leptothrix ochracea]EIM31396.1 universal stress protein UspA-like protein [Leptothrix ochracea L12]